MIFKERGVWRNTVNVDRLGDDLNVGTLPYQIPFEEIDHDLLQVDSGVVRSH